MGKNKLRESRDGSIRLELDLGKDDKVMELISRSNGLFFITKEKILRYRSPDSLDPDLECATAPWEQSFILPLGSTDPIVARTVIQTHRAISAFFPDNSKEHIQLCDISWEVMNSLVSLQFINERLKNQIYNIVEIVEADLESYTKGQSPKPLPAVSYYDIEFRSFVNEVKRCLDTISELFPILSELEFGKKHNSFKKEFSRGHFHKAQAWAKKNGGNSNPLAQMLEDDQRWIGAWIAIRIAIEHPVKNKYVETLNFSLEADRKVRLPTWRFIHPDYDMARPQNLLEIFDTCIENLLKFYEDLQITLLNKQLSSSIAIFIESVPEKHRDIEMPLRYIFTRAIKKETES